MVAERPQGDIARGTPKTKLVLNIQEVGRSSHVQLQGNILVYSKDILLLGLSLCLLWLQGYSITW